MLLSLNLNNSAAIKMRVYHDAGRRCPSIGILVFANRVLGRGL